MGAIGAAEGRGEREGLKELGPGWVVWAFFFFSLPPPSSFVIF